MKVWWFAIKIAFLKYLDMKTGEVSRYVRRILEAVESLELIFRKYFIDTS